MKIFNKQDKGYIEVWLTNDEQQEYDLNELTKQLLSETTVKKCKVVYFLSGSEDLFTNTEGLLLKNLGCA
ncbi:MAG: hypothetical protein IKK91_03310 [Ruminococcus sp.]|nr:hypothetical protein [Ruminococcus sp.]